MILKKTINYVKSSEIYKMGTVWCNLVFFALRTGQDVFSDFFILAQSIADEKNETSNLFNNDTWNLAGEIFFSNKSI